MIEPAVGLRVRLRRPHACGSDVFVVGGVGADIRIFCEGCQAKIFLERPRWKTRVKEVLPAATAKPGAVPPAVPGPSPR
ncbi:MAG TPA: DUF951 family protein [Candidatus Dormibacteraeota bacterium]|jgi:hypothetical protein|nr:DUF951 family protein [Candidatus Dormibacteraeota bacterium]